MVPVKKIVDYFLTPLNDEEYEPITNLKLQKLLYYCQGLSLAYFDRPMFEDKICHWDYGPVVETVYRSFKTHGRCPLPLKEAGSKPTFTDEELFILEKVQSKYGQYTASKLSSMTHSETPWLSASKNEEITNDIMKSFFKKTLPKTTFNFDLDRMKERVEGESVTCPPEAMKNLESFNEWLSQI